MTRNRDLMRQDLVLQLDERQKSAMTRVLKEIEKLAPTERAFNSSKKTIFDIFLEEFNPLIRELGNNATIPHKETRQNEIYANPTNP